MSSNQRGPVYFFVALIGIAFACLCLVAVGFGASRFARDFNGFNSPNAASAIFPSPTPMRVIADSSQAVQPAAAPVEITIDPAADAEPQILRAVYLKVNPSVVKVENLTTITDSTQTQDLVPQGQGSGFVWDASGLIVTNAHVVEGTDTVRVVFSDDRSVTGQVLGADPNSDLAVIQIDPTGFDLHPRPVFAHFRSKHQRVDRVGLVVQVHDNRVTMAGPVTILFGSVDGINRDRQFTVGGKIRTGFRLRPAPLKNQQCRNNRTQSRGPVSHFIRIGSRLSR